MFFKAKLAERTWMPHTVCEGGFRDLQGSPRLQSVPERGCCVHGVCVGEGSYIYLYVGVSYLTYQLMGLLFV